MRAYVLLSGGIDSTTCLYMACKEHGSENVGAICINYGQRHLIELEHAERSCRALGIKHSAFLNLSHIIPITTLTDPDSNIPDKPYSELDGISPTYVPFRNGLMISAAAAHVHAEWSIAPEDDDDWLLYIGAHAEDAHNWAYPDCTPEFIGAMQNAIYIGTYRAVRLVAPLQYMTKAEIVLRACRLGVEFRDTWSCYRGGEIHCGTCPTCRARRAAFKDAYNMKDPTKYAA